MAKAKQSTAMVRTQARAMVPRAVPLALPTPFTTVIELETAFDDASLEMNAGGDKFRVAAALQASIVAAAEAADDAQAAAAAAQVDATAALADAAAAQVDATAALADAAAAQVDATAALADAAAAQATADAAFASAGIGEASPPYVGLLRAPASPNVWDDEFVSGSADLALRGWTVQVEASATVATRIGPFDPSAAAMSAGQYRSSIIGGKLCIQSPTGLFISKTVGLTGALATRVSAFEFASTGSHIWGLGVSSTPQHSGGSNYFIFGWNQGNQLKMLSYAAGSYANAGAVTGMHQLDAYNHQWFNYTIVGTSMTAAETRHISEYSGLMAYSVLGGAFGTFAARHGGLLLGGGPRWYEIDFIRQYPVGKFFPT